MTTEAFSNQIYCSFVHERLHPEESGTLVYMESVCDLVICRFEPENRDEKISQRTAGECLKLLMAFLGGDEKAGDIM